MSIGQPQKPNQNTLFRNKAQTGQNESSLLGHKGSFSQMSNSLLNFTNCSVGNPCKSHTFPSEQPRRLMSQGER